MAIKIITDSTCDIMLPEAEKMGIEIVPLKVNFGTDSYVDKFTITNDEFYAKLAESKEMPTTTLVNPQEFIEVFNKYPNDTIVGLFISPKLSGTYQSAVVARDQLEREDIYLIDSTSTTLGLGLLIQEAIKLRDQGMSGADMYATLSELANKLVLYAIIDTLKYLVKGGRLSSTQGLVGNVLGIKPIIKLEDGVIHTISKERGTKRAINSLIKLIQDETEIDETKDITFAHSDNLEEVENLIQSFGKTGNIYSIGSVVGTHAGPKALGIAFFRK